MGGEKMRSRCEIHMLVVLVSCHCPESVQEWVKVKKKNSQSAGAGTRQCGSLNAAETLFKGMLTNK